MPTKIDGINLQDSQMLNFMQKINYIPSFFFKILQRYYKLAIFDTFGMPGYDQ